MGKMNNREINKTVKIRKQFKKASRKNKNSSRPINYSRTKLQVYFKNKKENLYRDIFHRLALQKCNTEL